jgi:hypothetical protein
MIEAINKEKMDINKEITISMMKKMRMGNGTRKKTMK